MKSLRKIASGLIGFDRRERRGSYILSILLLILLLVRVFALRPGSEAVTSGMVDTLSIIMEVEAFEDEKEILFSFDPNTASFDDLIRLGLTERQATTLINYRSSGARFREAGDIKRVYGIDSAAAAHLIPWISIKKAADKSVPKEKTTVPEVIAALTPAEKPPLPMIDINLCSADDLVQLPGIGPVLSERIIKFRKLMGGFVSIAQMREVYGLDSAAYANIEDRLTVTADSVTLLLLDSCSYNEMSRHPYLGPEAARLIMKYRSVMGRSVTLGDLVTQHLLSHDQAVRLAPYIRPPEGVKRDDYEFISIKVLK